MASDKDTWVEAAAKLIKETQQGRIRWSTDPGIAGVPPLKDVVGAVFYASYQGKLLRLRRRLVASVSAGVFAVGEQRVRKTYLDFLDDNGKAVWTAPQVQPLDDLYTVVQYQVAGVRDFLDGLLGQQ